MLLIPLSYEGGVPDRGIEPRAYDLSDRCSTGELDGHDEETAHSPLSNSSPHLYQHATPRGYDPPAFRVTGGRSSTELRGHAKSEVARPRLDQGVRTSTSLLSIRRGSNPRSSPWQGDAVPLGHECSYRQNHTTVAELVTGIEPASFILQG